jgi:hypothetical protein
VISRIGKFIVAICKTWSAVLTGGFLIAIVGSWQDTGHNIPPRLGWALIMGGIVVAAFQVWNQQVTIVESLREIIASQSPSKLIVNQKKTSGSTGIKAQPNGMVFVMYMTLLISNRSKSPNSVVEYEAQILNNYGEFQPINVEQGRTPDFEFCVTPLSIPSMSTVEAILAFIETSPAKYGQPFRLKIGVTDMHGEKSWVNANF